MSGFGANLVPFTAAFAVAIASPGPVAAALVARGMAIGGLVGDWVFASFVLFGLALIAKSSAVLIGVLRYGGAIWLIWLGYRLLSMPTETLHGAAPGSGALLNGLAAGAALSLANPKAVLVCAAIFPESFAMGSLTAAQIAAIYAVIATILIGGHLVTEAAAAIAGRLLNSTRAAAMANRVFGGVLPRAGVAIAASSMNETGRPHPGPRS